MGAADDRFRDLFDAHSRAVLDYLLRRLAQPSDAADVLADVFVVAWRRIDDVPAGDEARPWLFGVARLALQNERRRQRRHAALTVRLRAQLPDRPPPVESSRDAGGLREALARLSEDDRELLTMVGWDGLTPAQAAVVLAIPSGTVRVRLHRARQRLQALLDRPKRPGCTGHAEDRRAAAALPGSEES